MRGLRAEDAGGPDWFETNPHELAAIYAQVVETDEGRYLINVLGDETLQQAT